MGARRGQAGTENLTVLAAALILMIVAGVLLFQSGIVDIAKDARIQRSENYWATARPFSVATSKVYPSGMIIELKNSEPVSLTVTGLKIDGRAADFSSTNAPIEPYSTDRCTGGACSLSMRPGLVQILSMANVEGFANPCLSAGGVFEEKKIYELDVEITYAGGGQSGISQKGNVKLAGACTSSGTVPTCPYAPLLCCGGAGSYDDTTQICCNDAASSYVCNKPFECGGGSCAGSPTCGGTPGTACCGTDNYYLSEEICCPGPTQPYLRPAGTHCGFTCPIYTCKGEEYQPGTQICCSDTKWPYVCDAGLKCSSGNCEEYVCGMAGAYDPRKQKCCSDAPEAYIVNIGAQCAGQAGYCGSNPYDPATERCCTDFETPYACPISQQCQSGSCSSYQCSGVDYDPSIESCCGGASLYRLKNEICCSDAAKAYVVQAGQQCNQWCSQFLCNGEEYNSSTHQCCMDKSPEYLCLLQQECSNGCLDYICGSNAYDPQVQGCCGTTLYNLGGEQDCCAGALFNATIKQCCNSPEDANSSNDYLCNVGALCQNGGCWSSCGSIDYDTGTAVCCTDMS